MKHLIQAPAVLLDARARRIERDPLHMVRRLGEWQSKGVPKLWAGAGDRAYSYDAALQLADGAVAMTASGWAQNGGADGIIDLGGLQTVTPVQQARIDAALPIFVTALDTVTGDESYVFKLLGSNTASFPAASVAELGSLTIGGIAGKTTLGIANSILSTTGMFEILFTNEQNNVKYQYLKLWLVIAGTSPSITFNAFVAEIPRT